MYGTEHGQDLKHSLVHPHVIDVEEREVTSGQQTQLVCPIQLEDHLTA